MQISDVFFNDEVTLEKPVGLKKPSGSLKRTWEVVGSSIVAALQPMSVREMELYAGRQIRVTHNCYVESDPIFKRGYRLVNKDGKKFIIKGVINFAGTDRVWKIICKEILE